MTRIAVLGGGPRRRLRGARPGAGRRRGRPLPPGAPRREALRRRRARARSPRLAGFDPSPLPAVRQSSGPAGKLPRAAARRWTSAESASSAVATSTGDRRGRRGGRGVPRRARPSVWSGGQTRPGDRRRRDPRIYDWIVGADGARGLSAAHPGSRCPEGTASASEARSPGSPGTAWSSPFPDLADSYLWIFPRPGGASVGIAYTPARLTDGAARAALDAFLDRHLPAGWRDLPGPRYRYPIPVFGPWTLAAVRRGSRPPRAPRRGRRGPGRSAHPRGHPLRPALRPLGGGKPARRGRARGYPRGCGGVRGGDGAGRRAPAPLLRGRRSASGWCPSRGSIPGSAGSSATCSPAGSRIAG